MKKAIILFIFMGFNMNMPAQDPVQRITENDLQSFSEGRPIATTNIDALYEGVKGSPYFTEEWSTGNIYFVDGTEIIQIDIRFNIYKDELEFKNSTSGQIFVIDKNRIKGFRLHEPVDSLYFEYLTLKPDKPGERSFIQVLYNGETRLLLKHKKQFIQADYKGAYASGNKYDEYRDDKDYYLAKDNLTVQKIRLNKKALLHALEDKQSMIKEYAAVNQIDFSSPVDVIRLLKLCDSHQPDN